VNRLRELREERGWTQKQLGDLLKVQKAAVSKYERGNISLTDNLIQQIVEIFDVSADYLLGYSDIRDPSLSQNDILKIALFGKRDIDDKLLASVHDFASFALEQKRKNKE